MTIEKGVPWGERVAPPADTPTFTDCAALGAHLRTIPTFNSPNNIRQPHEFVLHDVSFRSLLGIDHEDNGNAIRIPIDVLEVSFVLERGEDQAVALDHVMLGGRLLWDELVLVSNTGFWRSRRIAPRAHPNDGRADVVTVSARMGIRQRLLAWRRARWGTHLPHPAINIEQHAQYHWSGAPRLLTIDGAHRGIVTSVHVRVVADALVVYV